MTYRSTGDPCKTRFKIYKTHLGKWRTFELAQPGQRISLHEDLVLWSWQAAMDYANGCVRIDREKCRKYNELLGPPREDWPT